MSIQKNQKRFEANVETFNTGKCEDAFEKFPGACEKGLLIEVQTVIILVRGEKENSLFCRYRSSQ